MKAIRQFLLILLTLNLFAVFTPAAQGEILDSGLGTSDEPLPPDQAFVLSTKMVQPDILRAEWDIVDGYYMYKDKFKFVSNTNGIELQPANFPKGKIKEDEFFGKVETYRGKIGIDIPVSRTADIDKLDLTVVSQGCADIGICYPPQKQQVSVALPAMVAMADIGESADSNSINPIAALKRLSNSLGLTTDEEEFLPADQVFIYSATVENPNMIRARWDIKSGYYLYQDKFKFELQDADGIAIGKIVLPPGEKKYDANFGDMIVYHDRVDIDIPLIRTKLDPTEITLVAKYQGCAERGFCYPPQKQLMPLMLPKATAQKVATSTDNTSSTANTSGIEISEQDALANTIKNENIFYILLIFFAAGLALSFTPCVFPMIPILSSIIVGQGSALTTRKAFIMSLVYVLAMALTYTFAGVIAGVSGANLQAAFQNAWVLGTFSAVFVALAFSMFGFYELQMPSFIQSRLTEFSNKQQGGTLTGVAIMGFLSALIVGPCVAAPLMGALIYISQTGDAVFGGMALFSLSMGMGVPLLVIGTSAGKLLPKAGGWMDSVKAVFGVTMIAVAIWMLERVVPVEITMLLWALLLIVSGIYMGALEQIKEGASGWMRLWKGLGLAALIYGAIIVIGVAAGGKDVLQPLGGISLGGSSSGFAHSEADFKRVKSIADLEAAVKSANDSGKVAMLDFYADWCVSCKEMEKYTFANPGVQEEFENMVLLQADVTANDNIDKALLKKFGLFGPPSLIFFGKDGKENRAHRIVGFMEADKFKRHLQRIK